MSAAEELKQPRKYIDKSCKEAIKLIKSADISRAEKKALKRKMKSLRSNMAAAFKQTMKFSKLIEKVGRNKQNFHSGRVAKVLYNKTKDFFDEFPPLPEPVKTNYDHAILGINAFLKRPSEASCKSMNKYVIKLNKSVKAQIKKTIEKLPADAQVKQNVLSTWNKFTIACRYTDFHIFRETAVGDQPEGVPDTRDTGGFAAFICYAFFVGPIALALLQGVAGMSGAGAVFLVVGLPIGGAVLGGLSRAIKACTLAVRREQAKLEGDSELGYLARKSTFTKLERLKWK